MQVVIPQDQSAAALLGRLKVRKSEKYRRTKLMISVACEGGKLYLNTLTGELLFRGPHEGVDRNELIEKWFMVPRSFDETGHADELRRIARMLVRSDGKTHFTILTTTDCNAHCAYCYEAGARRISMTPETAADVGTYIAREARGQTVHLSWFGGEPLLNGEAIDVICRVLRESGVEFRSKLTTNGYFLNGQTAGKAVREWGLREVQITLDGTERVYNSVKNYVPEGDESTGFLGTESDVPEGSGSPYLRVMENVGAALRAGLTVLLRLNLSRDNAEDLPALADELAARFPDRTHLNTQVVLVAPLAGHIHEFASEKEAYLQRKKLEEKLMRLGLMRTGVLARGVRVNQCIADNDACEVILPDGRIQRCEHFDESEVAGSIYSPERDREIIAKWKETVRFENCAECPLYPRCVSLKWCGWLRDGCSDERKKYLIEKTRDRMIATYKKAREERIAAAPVLKEDYHHVF